MPTVGYTRCHIPNVTNGELGHDVVNRIDFCTRGAVTRITPSLELDVPAFSYPLWRITTNESRNTVRGRQSD